VLAQLLVHAETDAAKIANQATIDELAEIVDVQPRDRKLPQA
jgi:hypothetical protein